MGSILIGEHIFISLSTNYVAVLTIRVSSKNTKIKKRRKKGLPTNFVVKMNYKKWFKIILKIQNNTYCIIIIVTKLSQSLGVKKTVLYNKYSILQRNPKLTWNLINELTGVK